MAKFIPMINCGYNSGDSPMCWNGVPFETEQECEQWIDENTDNFTMNELGGGVFTFKLED